MLGDLLLIDCHNLVMSKAAFKTFYHITGDVYTSPNQSKMPKVLPDQKSEIWLSTCPLWGMPVARI